MSYTGLVCQLSGHQKKYLSRIYCRRKSHGPIQSKGKKVIVLYKYYHRHARIKDVFKDELRTFQSNDTQVCMA